MVCMHSVMVEVDSVLHCGVLGSPVGQGHIIVKCDWKEKCDRTQGTKNRKEQRSEQLQNYKVHEVRTASRPALADISGGGFFIRRVESPAGPVPVKGAVQPRARHTVKQQGECATSGSCEGCTKEEEPLA